MIFGNNGFNVNTEHTDVFSDGTVQTSVGNIISGNNGVSAKVGNMLMTPNGSVTKIGNTFSTPTGTWTKIGSVLNGPNGETFFGVHSDDEAMRVINHELNK